MDTNLSRSGRSDQRGKLIMRIDVPMSEEMYEDIIAMSKIAGTSKSEYIRNEMEKVIYGALSALRNRAGLLDSSQRDESRTNI